MKRSPFYGAGTMTLEPDGTATGCNPVQVGSTPTGVSWKQGSDVVWTSGASIHLHGFGSMCTEHGL